MCDFGLCLKKRRNKLYRKLGELCYFGKTDTEEFDRMVELLDAVHNHAKAEGVSLLPKRKRKKDTERYEHYDILIGEEVCTIIRDKHSGLEWFVDKDIDITWKEADSRVCVLNENVVNSLRWRLPIIKELRTLCKYDGGVWDIDASFKTSGKHIWSCEGTGTHRRIGSIGLSRGDWGSYTFYEDSKNMRAFFVRGEISKDFNFID